MDNHKVKKLIMILMILILASAAKATVCDGLIAYWPFDETTGISYADDVNGHSLFPFPYDNTVYTTSGKINAATKGSDNTATLSGTQAIKGTTAQSVAFWIRDFYATNGGGMYLYNANSGTLWNDFGWFIYGGWIGGDNFGIGFSANNSYYDLCATAPSTVVNKMGWHLLVFTFDSTASPMAEIYVDGNSVATEHTNSSFSPLDSSAILSFLLFSPDGGPYTQAIDELAIWDKALTQDEVNDIWNDGNGIALNEITLTYIAGANGSITGDTSQTLPCIESDGTEVTAVPDGGYAFSIWSDGVLTAARTDVNVTGDVNVTALFAAAGTPSQSITTSVVNGGTITTPGIGTYWYDAGTEVNIVALADDANRFVNWTGTAADASKVADVNVVATTVTVDANYTVIANFTIANYTLTYTAGANGSVTGTLSQTVDYGEDGNAVSAVNDVNYHFVSWSDGSTANPRQDVNVTADVNVVANFATTLSRSLRIWAVGNGYISIPGAGTFWYDNNTDANIAAVANPGYAFMGWFSDGQSKIVDANLATTKIRMDANYSVAAYFNVANGITMTPSLARFPLTPLGSFSDVNVTVHNDGNGVKTVPVSIGTSFYGYYTVASPSPFTIVGDITLILGPNSISDTNDTCIMTLRYTPTIVDWVWGPLYAVVSGQVYAQMYMAGMGYSVPLECFFCTEQ